LSDDLIFGIVYIPPEGSSYLSGKSKMNIVFYLKITNISVCLGILTDDPDFIEIFINEHELDFTQFVENDLAVSTS
jgi:hypothetical protein